MRELTQKENTQGGNTQKNGDLGILMTPSARKIRRQSENSSRKGLRRRSKDSYITNGDRTEAVTLFEVVCIGKRAMQSVVEEWIEAYQEDRDAAVLDLINFYIQCSGCQGMVTAELFQKPTNSEIMEKLTEEFDDETGLQFKKFMVFPWILTVTWPVNMDNEHYPLIKPGIYWKKFKANFCEFTSMLIQQCWWNGVICDGFFLDTIISLLLGMSDSCIRAFRHTGTLIAVKLLTALIRVILNLDVSLHNLQTLYNAEKDRLPRRRSSPREEHMETKKEELQQQVTEIKTMMDVLFKGTFLQRYRDVVSEIRATCIEELGIWMKMYPQSYLNDSCLKYIGWMLYDKQPEVRLKCILSLQRLYEQNDLVSRMDLFTIRFKDRILSMTLDKDNDVCVQVMRLLVLMSQNCEDLFTQEDCESLYQFVYTAHRPLAAAAGEFLYRRHLKQFVNDKEVEGSTEGTKDNARQLKILLTFFCENELHEHLAYLVDSLWDCNPGFLKDWQCMSSILLQDTNEKDALNIIQERLLIELLLASVRQAVIGHPPVGRGTMKKVLSAKEKKVQLEDRVKITEHFAGTLHLLLAKFFTEPEKMANLLQILQYFDMEVYCSLGLNKNLEVLLNQLNHTVEIHSDPEVLEACSKAYISLSKRNLECQANVDLSKKQLMDQLVDTFNKMLHDILHEREVPLNAEDVDQMSCVLRRLAAFHNGHDLTQWNLYQKTSQLLLFEDEHRCLPVQLLLPAFQCMYYALLWKVLAVIEDKPSKEDLVLFKAHLTTFWSLCKHYLHYQDQPMQEQAFLSLCDLLFLLSHRSRGIYCCVDSSLQSELLLFVQHHVFQGDEDLDKAASLSENNEENMEGLYKRRNLLAVYCKLIIYNVVEMAAASEIYKEYIKAYNDFGDIIKEILSRTRQSDRIESAKTLVLCLQQLFQKHKEEYGSASQYSASFSNIKEMARRFSLTFGLDHLKYRESVTMMHKQGIEFAFREPPLKDSGPPPNLPFLILINEFSSKLLKADKRLVYGYLQRFASEQMLLYRGAEWTPLVVYSSSLLDTQDEEGSVSCSFYSKEHGFSPVQQIQRKTFAGIALRDKGASEDQSTCTIKSRKRHILHGEISEDDLSLYSLQPSSKRISTEEDSDDGNKDVIVDEVFTAEETALVTKS